RRGRTAVGASADVPTRAPRGRTKPHRPSAAGRVLVLASPAPPVGSATGHGAPGRVRVEGVAEQVQRRGPHPGSLDGPPVGPRHLRVHQAVHQRKLTRGGGGGGGGGGDGGGGGGGGGAGPHPGLAAA